MIGFANQANPFTIFSSQMSWIIEGERSAEFFRKAVHLLLFVLVVFMPRVGRCQEISKLEDSLHRRAIDDSVGIRRRSLKLLRLDPYNEWAIRGFTDLFKDEGFGTPCPHGQDSLNIFFAGLIKQDFGNPRPYYLKAMYGVKFYNYPDHDSLTLAFLQQALSVDSDYVPTNLELGRRYNDQFVKAMQTVRYGCFGSSRYLKESKRGKKFAFDYQERMIKIRNEQVSYAALYAPLVARHLGRVWHDDTSLHPILHLALLQVANYLRDGILISEVSQYREIIRTDSSGIPIDSPKRYFTIDFLTDTTYYGVPVERPIFHDYLNLADRAKFKQEWYSEPLAFFHEPLLMSPLAAEKEIYRFTWIGSFHAPAVFRLEHSPHTTILFYKTFIYRKRKSGGKNIYLNKRKKITRRQYDTFRQLIQQSDFFQQPTFYGLVGTDGARWLLEGYSNQKYHLVDRWSEGDEIEKPCRYLIKLAGQKLRGKEFY